MAGVLDGVYVEIELKLAKCRWKLQGSVFKEVIVSHKDEERI